MLETLAKLLLGSTVISMLVAVGLETTPAALRATWRQRRILLRTLLVVLVGVPLLAVIVVRVLPLHPLVATIVVLMAICPGAPLILRKVDGRALMVVTVAMLSLLTVITVPVSAAIVDRALPLDLVVEPAALARISLAKLILPLGVGVAIGALWPRMARPLARVAWGVFFAGLALALVLVLRLAAPVLLDASPWALLAVLSIVAGSAALGHWAGRPRPDDEEAMATVAVLGNPALALAVVAQSFPGYRAGALMAAYLLARALAFLPYGVVMKRRRGRGGRRPQAPAPMQPAATGAP